MNIDVVIATANRAESLRRTLQSLMGLEQPVASTVTIWVVDNGSTDNTKNVVAEFTEKSRGQINYISEKQPGKNRALNTAISKTNGEICVLTDDDVSFDKSWLTVIAENFRDPSVQCLTGKIIPAIEKPLPTWYSEKCSAVIGHIDFSKDRTTTDYATGANMAILRTTFEKIGGFSIHGKLINEDTFLSRKLMDRGISIVYDPRMLIYHHFQPERLTKTYFRRWYWTTGLSISEINRGSDAKEPCWFGIARWRYRRALEHLGGLMINLFNEKESFYHELQLQRFMGYCTQRWQHRAERE